jgi:hypothetical protein
MGRQVDVHEPRIGFIRQIFRLAHQQRQHAVLDAVRIPIIGKAIGQTTQQAQTMSHFA